MARKSKEQIAKENHNKATIKHIRENYRTFKIQLHNERQKDIIEHLEQKENKQQYITDLIRKDMEHSRE